MTAKAAVDGTDAAAHVCEAMRDRLDDLTTLQRVAAGELPDLTADVPWDHIRSVMGINVQFDPAADSAELADMAADQIDEAALCVEATTTFEIVLGTGGPEDRLLIECDGGREESEIGAAPSGYEIRRILYRYSWSGSAERVLSGADFDTAERFAHQVVPELVG